MTQLHASNAEMCRGSTISTSKTRVWHHALTDITGRLPTILAWFAIMDVLSALALQPVNAQVADLTQQYPQQITTT